MTKSNFIKMYVTDAAIEQGVAFLHVTTTPKNLKKISIGKGDTEMKAWDNEFKNLPKMIKDKFCD